MREAAPAGPDPEQQSPGSERVRAEARGGTGRSKEDRMSSVESASELRFDPPGPGSWDLDAVHFPRPVTRYWAEVHPEPFMRGFRECTRFYGLLMDTLENRYVNGFVYKTVLPIAEGDAPERFQRAEEV